MERNNTSFSIHDFCVVCLVVSWDEHQSLILKIISSCHLDASTFSSRNACHLKYFERSFHQRVILLVCISFLQHFGH